jgi:hypothetical protein
MSFLIYYMVDLRHVLKEKKEKKKKEKKEKKGLKRKPLMLKTAPKSKLLSGLSESGFLTASTFLCLWDLQSVRRFRETPPSVGRLNRFLFVPAIRKS